MAASTADLGDGGSSNGLVKRKRSNSKLQQMQQYRKEVVFWKRKWNPQDLGNLIAVLIINSSMLVAPFFFTWGAFRVAVIFYVITTLFGIYLSYHRNLTHTSFKLPKWLEYTFAYCGLQAGQGDPIFWISTHKYHHQFVDSERDPHSPIEGFWFGHVTWLFDINYFNEKCGVEVNNVMDLQKQAYYRFLERTYRLHILGLGVLLYAVGGIPYVIWGMGVRMAISQHNTFMVNSACHLWGQRPWNTKDLSTNNWLMGIIAFGDGWHNNHHAFEFSARHGFEWWQIDVTWYVIKLLEYVGLATDVKVPSETQLKRRMLSSTSQLK